MRELVYLSQRKLSQFQPTRARGGFLRRVTGVSVRAPLALGEVNLTLAQESVGSRAPDLQTVIDEISRRARGVQWYESGDVQVGDWIKFESQMNYAVLDDRAFSKKPRRQPHRGPLLFWEPKDYLDRGRVENLLVLHGSPDGLVGVRETVPEPNLVEDIAGSDSAAPSVIRTLRQLRRFDDPLTLGDMDGFGLLAWVLGLLDHQYPSFTASWMAGYARVTGLPDARGPMRFLLATPLYVERLPPPKGP